MKRFISFYSVRPLLDHLNDGGVGLKPYCELLPGGRFGFFFQQMQNLFFYMLLLTNNNSIDDRTVHKIINKLKWLKIESSALHGNRLKRDWM